MTKQSSKIKIKIIIMTDSGDKNTNFRVIVALKYTESINNSIKTNRPNNINNLLTFD